MASPVSLQHGAQALQPLGHSASKAVLAAAVGDEQLVNGRGRLIGAMRAAKLHAVDTTRVQAG